MQFGRKKKPNIDGINLLVSILVCYPEIGTISFEPKEDALHFSFALQEVPPRQEYESAGELIRESILTYHSIEGFDDGRIEIYLEGQGHTAFFHVIRDIRTISQGEISMISAIMRERFGETLIVDPDSRPDDFEFDLAAHENAIDHMIGTLADCFTTRTFNIGMDEAHMLGRGRYMDNHGPVNRTDLMLRHLGKVMEICRRYGVRAQMWSDMFYSEPYTRYGGKRSDADVALLPADVDPVFWYYDETHKDFYDQAFDGQRRMFGKNCHYAGAARKWTGFAPNNRFSIEVGKASLTSAAEHEVRSAVLTAWGDNGSEASMFSILPVIWYDSALAYEYLGRAESDIGELKPDDKAFCALTGMSYERYMAVDALRWFGYPAYSSNADKFLLYNDPLQGVFDSVVPQIDLKAHYEEALSDIRRTVPLAGRFAYLFETLEKLAALLVLKCDLGYRLTRAYQAGDREQLAAILDEIPVIVSRLDSFEASFRAQWMKENRSFGYEIQSQRLGGLRARLLYVADALKAYLDGSLESIEELEITKLPFDLSGDSEVFNMEYNQHRNMVSFNIC